MDKKLSFRMAFFKVHATFCHLVWFFLYLYFVYRIYFAKVPVILICVAEALIKDWMNIRVGI